MLDVTPYRVSPANWPPISSAHRRHLGFACLRALDAALANRPNRRRRQCAGARSDRAARRFFRPPSRSRRESCRSSGRSALALRARSAFSQSWQSRLVHGALPRSGDGGESVRRALRHMARYCSKTTCSAIEEWRVVLARGPCRPDGHPRRRRHWRGLDDLRGRSPKLPTMLRRSCWRMSRSSFRARQSASR